MKISPINRAKSIFSNIANKNNGRIKKIAIEVLKVLGLTLLGGLMGGLTLASSGTVWIVVGAALGVGTALGSYGVGKGIVHLQKKHVFPAHAFKKSAPVDPSKYFNNEKEKDFDRALDRIIKPLPEYAAWKKLRGNKSDRQARRIFRKAIRSQCSLGQSYALAESAGKKQPIDPKAPFDKAPADILFSKQILQVMAKDLGEKGKDLHAKIHHMPTAPREKSLHFNKEAFPSKEALLQEIKKPLIGTATMIRGKQRYTLFFEVTEKGGRFYDGSHRLAGFHDGFGSQEEFLNLFYKHLRTGMLGKKILRKQYDSMEMELFRIQ